MIMKRMILLALCLFLMGTCAVTAAADEGDLYATAGELYEAWVSRDCVPDYITGVWSTYGEPSNLTFGVVKGEAGVLGMQEILALVRNDSTVTFVCQTYSRNYLYGIQDEIVDAYFGKNLGLVTAGVNEYENKLYFEVHIDFAENPDTLAMIRTVTEQYGDAVAFRSIDVAIQPVVQTQPSVTGPALVVTQPQKLESPLLFAFGLCGLAAACFFLLQMQRRRVMAVAADGPPVIMDSRPVRIKDVEDAIRKAENKPSEALDDRVMCSIRDIKE
jgi:hypothetical protein